METTIFEGSRLPSTKDSDFLQNFSAKKRDFQDFVEVYKKDLYTFLTLMSGDKDSSYQYVKQLFVKSYYKITKISDGESFKLWLYKLAISYARKMEGARSDEIEEWKQEEDEYFDLEGTGTKISREKVDLRRNPEALNRLDCLGQIFGELDFEQRAILIIKDVLNLSPKFISEVLSLSEGTVKLRLAKGREAFSIHSRTVEIERRERL